MKLLEINADRVPAEKIGPDLWRVTCDYKASYQTDEGTLLWTVHEGFKLNFRSGSSLINYIIPKRGKYGPFFCLHDASYNNKGDGVSRKLADWLLVSACRKTGMSGWRCWLMEKAVRLFGKPAYSDSQKHLITFMWSN